jgi:EXLDI family protein
MYAYINVSRERWRKHMQREVSIVPNRTIYVADADVQLFEKAQVLAGGNLSAAIVEALRRFVEDREGKESNFEEITVDVGKITRIKKRFQGRLLAKGRAFEQNETRRLAYSVYQTPKGNLAVYIRNTPNWNYWSNRKSKRHHWSEEDWTNWNSDDNDFRLEVYATLEELEYNVPPELFEAVALVLRGTTGSDGVEVLDI